MDFEYDVMGSVDVFCKKIAEIDNITVTPNDSLEIPQNEDDSLIGDDMISKNVRGKRKNKKTVEKKSTRNQSQSQANKLQSEPVESDVSKELSEDSFSSRESSEILKKKNSQRGNARRTYMSELANSNRVEDTLDLTALVSAQENPGTSRRAKRMAARNKNQSSKQQQKSNVICIGSDEEDANIIYEPIKIKNTDRSCTLNASLSNLETENPEYSVKIEWINKIETFPLRKYQKFYDIFNILSKRENVDLKDIVLNLNSKFIYPHDTPDSLNYLSFDVISGRVIKNNSPATRSAKTKKDNNQVSIKLQSNVWKRHISISIKKTDTFKILYIKCSEELKLPFTKFTLLFDGDKLEMNGTPNDLNFEDGEIIDCVVKK